LLPICPRGEVTKTKTHSSPQNLAKENAFFSLEDVPDERVITETEATDSYQNVLFSLLLSRLYTGSYPQRITVVTHEFKRERFFNYHFPAIGWTPFQESIDSSTFRGRNRVDLIGINPPPEITSPESLIEGELKRGIGLWSRDRYGVGEELTEKRKKRGWSEPSLMVGRGLEPVVEKLLSRDGGQGGNEWFPEMRDLPWYYGEDRSGVN
jgi:hypothetical protein